MRIVNDYYNIFFMLFLDMCLNLFGIKEID